MNEALDELREILNRTRAEVAELLSVKGLRWIVFYRKFHE